MPRASAVRVRLPPNFSSAARIAFSSVSFNRDTAAGLSAGGCRRVLLTGSVFVYFLQPTLGTALVALAFFASLAMRRPLCERLATDFVPIPDEVLAHDGVRRFFRQITLLWALTQLANAAVTLWLLVSQSLATFLVARTVTSWALVGSAIAASTVWFRLSMRRHGILASPAPAPVRA